MAAETVPDTIPVVDTPCHSSNTGKAIHWQGPGNDVLVHLTTSKTSFNIWSTIERRFNAKSTIKISNMRHDLYSLKKMNLSIKEYVSKVKHLSDNLTAAGSFVSEQEQVSVILAGFSLEFDSIRVFASATHLSLDLLTEMLIDCEARQLDLLTKGPCQENLASRQQDTDIGSKQPIESNRYSQDHKQGYKGQGHGWSCGRSHKNGRALASSPPDQIWYPDSEAKNHITPDMENLTTASPYTSASQVSMGNGDSVSIAHIGSSNFLVGLRLLRLQTVLYVPTVCKNLRQFAQDNVVYFEFHPYLCFVKDI
ncbi:hypothetical protein PVK06_043010 [Gossypium arboreum]|uniref:Retrovirus-related Pol polyprotein from transposon TNT 1-94-like beta-barrel domain-containing protein n=1 Tax=Gossypium arboreum TaxID=29729 RepID=A0ABR0MMC4_GOSAR|nr:hypothetical protein PVK06_043010 [Gossypium arboreum]